MAEFRGQRRRTVVRVGASDQSGLPLERTLAAGILEEIEPEIVELLEEETAEAIAAAPALTVQVVDLELPAGRLDGVVIVEDAFTDAQIGTPVICSQGPPAEAPIVFVGEVINSRDLRVTWFAWHGAPARARLLYLLGAVE